MSMHMSFPKQQQQHLKPNNKEVWTIRAKYSIYFEYVSHTHCQTDSKPCDSFGLDVVLV